MSEYISEEAIVGAIAIICLTIYGIYALKKGIDGAIMVSVVGAISGIAGYEIKSYLVSRKQ